MVECHGLVLIASPRAEPEAGRTTGATGPARAESSSRVITAVG